MWLQAIELKKVQARLRENAKQLGVSGMVLMLLVLLNVLIYALVLGPSISRLKTGEEKADSLRKRHAEALLFKKQKPLFAGIMAGVPSQKDMPLLVKEIVQTAKQSNLSLASINYDIPKRESGELAMLSFSFPAEGKYPDLKRFIHEVETSDRLVGIQDLKFESEKGSIKLQMKLLTYVKGM